MKAALNKNAIVRHGILSNGIGGSININAVQIKPSIWGLYGRSKNSCTTFGMFIVYLSDAVKERLTATYLQ